ncbi:type III-A CRISPR-associated RAMP protein Csm3 [Pelotomaculum isophthalicicum JI]|uniref:CRISPR system Cms endoribonuclease Csm3 n=1 Tax=Pelotomaculum isophthalicicum JI TaxID=947010 RepID=A0A9X4GZF5_9FIRM|nr:type III-A CRISPR-associated RAMP protein Csm3 [Pelotomaculum isophthalicicum]MDF9408705.1 type III-A CRISPR-associated RAMP protein Csm3 [Pelotomaculum isophthalicicum JI]
MKLERHAIIKGVIFCETGLRIGGSNDDIEIGGNDNPIIRNPVTDLPYIPGSSLKGRMRSLLELKHSAITQQTGKPCDCGQCNICKIFGTHGTHKARESVLGPTRIIVRDAFLTSESVKELKAANQEKGIYYTEVKHENLVDRKTGKAEHPRPNERVPAGSKFDFEIVLRIFENDNENAALNLIREGLSLVQKEYLGGSGSRGYGKVRFINTTIDGVPFVLEEGK